MKKKIAEEHEFNISVEQCLLRSFRNCDPNVQLYAEHSVFSFFILIKIDSLDIFEITNLHKNVLRHKGPEKRTTLSCDLC